MNKLLLTVTSMILASSLAYAQAPAAKDRQAIKEQVKSACAADIATTGCTSEGREQMKCIKEYKKSHKDFKFSEGCKMARKEVREMHKNRKAHKDAKEDAKDTK